jgi:hypothetical protein
MASVTQFSSRDGPQLRSAERLDLTMSNHGLWITRAWLWQEKDRLILADKRKRPSGQYFRKLLVRFFFVRVEIARSGQLKNFRYIQQSLQTDGMVFWSNGIWMGRIKVRLHELLEMSSYWCHCQTWRNKKGPKPVIQLNMLPITEIRKLATDINNLHVL